VNRNFFIVVFFSYAFFLPYLCFGEVSPCAEALLPKEVALGGAVIYRYNFRQGDRWVRQTLTGLVPLSSEGASGTLLDLNALGYHDPLPQRFIIGDGSSRRALTGVDLTPGSPLDVRLAAIEQEIRQAVGEVSAESVLQHVRQHFNGFIGIIGGNGEPILAWDRALSAVPEWNGDLMGFADHHEPISVGFSRAVQPLEAYLEIKQGFCIQQALTASLLLRRFSIPHRLVSGAATDELEDHVGHNWIQLEDGRIYDLSGQIIVMPKRFVGLNRATDYPEGLETDDWFQVPGYPYSRFRFEYHRYPILVLP
jgi:hypothetical protein